MANELISIEKLSRFLSNLCLSGGSAGQVLKKSSATNYDFEWGSAGSGGSDNSIDARVTITSSNWSSTQTGGFYTYEFYVEENNKKVRIKNDYVPIFALVGSTDSTYPTNNEEAAYNLVKGMDYVDESVTESGDTYTATKFTLQAETKPTNTFYILVKAQEYS